MKNFVNGAHFSQQMGNILKSNGHIGATYLNEISISYSSFILFQAKKIGVYKWFYSELILKGECGKNLKNQNVKFYLMRI